MDKDKQGADADPLVVDHLILICRECGVERTAWPDVPLRGAKEIIEWLKTKTTRCQCGATHGDVKLHIANRTPEELKESLRLLKGDK